MENSYPQATVNSVKKGHITRREVQILTLMAEGNLNKQIGGLLDISTATVKKHVKNIYLKIGAHNKVEALNKTKWLTTSFDAGQN